MIDLSRIGISVKDDIKVIENWYLNLIVTETNHTDPQFDLTEEMLRRHKNNIAHFGYRSYLLDIYDDTNPPLAVFVNLCARDLAIVMEVNGLFEYCEGPDEHLFTIVTMEGQQVLNASDIGPRGFVYLCSRFNKNMISLLNEDEELMEQIIEDFLEDI